MRQMEEFVEQFKSLGDATRLKIIRLLCEAGEELCVCEIMDAIEDSHSNISRHLKILRAAGLVKEQKEGRWAYFSLTDPDSPFHGNLLQAVRNMPAENFTDDIERLKLRLSLREGEKCVDGLKSERWMSAQKLIRSVTINRYSNKRKQSRR
jgi:ArsR family transcriptional regulator, arsenate/arsenite/antimonite-responsive transcriptional repressor